MNRIYLDRDWQFSETFTEELISSPMEKGEKVMVPHTVKETPFHYFDESIYQMVSCYQRTIFGDPAWQGQEMILTFDAVGHDATVYLNGKELGRHRCGYTAFSVNLKDAIKLGEDNLLTVKVDSRESINEPPFGFVIDYMTYGGIYRDVYLTIKNPVHMYDVFYQPKLNGTPNTVGIDRKQLIQMRMTGEIVTEMQLSPRAKEYASQRKLTVRQLLDGQEISNQPLSEEGKTSTLAGKVGIWDIENPKLYELTTQLILDGEVVDEYSASIGFRDLIFKKEGFFLNGRRVKIRGVNRHQSYAYVGYAMPASMQRYDARILKKELGLNAVRTSHYPQSQDFIDECDKLGLLVFTEIPGWQHIGDAKWKDIAVENTRDMILQYRNHPSIMLWGVRINESPDDDEFYTRTNAVAHETDPTRQTGGVRCGKKMSLLEDVYTYNDFVHDGTNDGCEPKEAITPDVEKPYLISEYNGHMFPTKSYDCEEHVLEHTLRHARVLDAVASHSDICGSFAWCMFDYNTHKDFGSGDRVCYHGVMDMFRNPKPAASVYAAQNRRSDVLCVTSSMDIGEHPASVRGDTYIITNADSVKMYKNNVLIKEFFPSDSPFKHLKNGPIAIDDLIGDEMMKNEGFSRHQNELAKICLNETAIHGYKMSPKVVWAAARLMALYHMSMDDANKLYQKYIGDWGGESKEYRFEAVRDGNVVKTVTKAPMTKVKLNAKVSHTTLVEDYTYDVAELRLSACDEFDNVLPFFGENAVVTVEGPLEIIGPKTSIPFRGGMSGIYVKTTGETGSAKLTIRVPGANPLMVDFTIEKAEA